MSKIAPFGRNVVYTGNGERLKPEMPLKGHFAHPPAR
jgi:hypothetical protein